MEIIQVWITGRPNGSYLASVAMELRMGDHRFHIRGMRLINRSDRKFLAMPSRKTNKGWQDLIHPIDTKTRTLLEQAALKAYELSGPPSEDDDLLESL